MWDVDLVRCRLLETGDTLDRLPSSGGGGSGTSWPLVVREAAEAYGYTDTTVRPALPDRFDIDRMDRTLASLMELGPTHRTVAFGIMIGAASRKISRALKRTEGAQPWGYVKVSGELGRVLSVLAARWNTAGWPVDEESLRRRDGELQREAERVGRPDVVDVQVEPRRNGRKYGAIVTVTLPESVNTPS